MRITSLILAVLMTVCVYGQEAADTLPTVRPVYSAYMLEAGSAHLADTYLTPLHYRGIDLALRYQRSQAMRFDPERWSMQLSLGANFDQTENPAKNAKMVSAMFDASWRMWHRWRVLGSLTVGVGPGARADAGVLYLARNSNNPASAKASLTLDACACANYKLNIRRVPLTLRYQVEMPVVGAFFQPDYGQLYYQIYLGDRQNLMHCAWPGNYFMLDNQLTADFTFGGWGLRIGYHGNILSTKANNIVGNMFTHAVTIGVTTEWLSVRPGKNLNQARIIRYDE